MVKIVNDYKILAAQKMSLLKLFIASPRNTCFDYTEKNIWYLLL